MFSNLQRASLLAFLLASLGTIHPQQLDDSTSPQPIVNHGPSGWISKPGQFLRDLQQHGLSFNGMFVNDVSHELSDPGGSEWFGRYSFDLAATIDDKALGWKGATGYVRLKQHIREFGSDSGAAAQIYSNIDAPSWTGLYELWFEQKLLDNKLRFKLGKVDANTEFAAVATAADFLNSSMGYSPTIVAFPTYPAPKPSVNIFFVPATHYQVSTAVYQTSGNDALSMNEIGRTWAFGNSDREGHASVGYWHLFGSQRCFDGRSMPGTYGFYMVLEQELLRRARTQEGSDMKLSSFFQLGYGNNEINPFTRHYGGGAVLQGPIAARPHDAFALAMTRVNFSNRPTAGFDAHAESAIEAYYKINFAKPAALVVDFQYFHHPGAVMLNSDCLMFTPRLVLSF